MNKVGKSTSVGEKVQEKGEENMASTFGSRLKELRVEKNIRQEDLASDLGVTKGTVSKWERDVRRPDFEVIEQLTDYFGVNLGYLLGNDCAKEKEVPTDGELCEWVLSDEDVYLSEVINKYLQLSDRSKKIINAAIQAAYISDKESEQLEIAVERRVKVHHRVKD